MMGLQKFEHHFLCIGHERGVPFIVYYNATKKGAFRRLFSCSLTHPSLARVNIMALPDYINEDNLQKQGVEVKRVMWPDRLRRYSVEKITRRALTRLGEAHYHVTKNNCESFVMWCICNSNVSLQATRESIFALKIVTELSSDKERVNEDFFIVTLLYIIYLLVLLGKVKLPTLYAVAALYLTIFFSAKSFNLERGKYLHSTWGNPPEYEEQVRENVENYVKKVAASIVMLVIHVVYVVSCNPSGVYRYCWSIFLSFFIGQVEGHLFGRLSWKLMKYFLA